MCILGGTSTISVPDEDLSEVSSCSCRGDILCQEARSSDFMEPSIPLSERPLVFALLAFIYCSAVCVHIYSVASLIAAIVSLFQREKCCHIKMKLFLEETDKTRDY